MILWGDPDLGFRLRRPGRIILEPGMALMFEDSHQLILRKLWL